MKSKANKIPVGFHVLYMLLAAGFVYLYYLKIIQSADLNNTNSIDAVLSFETYKPWQFRLFIPFIFFLLKPLSFVPQITVFTFYSVIIVYLLVVVYCKVLQEYFENNRLVFFAAPVILYPMLWNYIILNQIFQYYDFTSILIFTLGLYFIIKEKFLPLLIVFIAGVLNKETAGYLVVAYLLFNYKIMFTKKVILNSLLMAAVFIVIKVSLGIIFSGNPGDPFELCTYENINIIKNFFSNRIYFTHIVFSFGLMYVFIFLLFLTGRWKRFLPRSFVIINLAFLPNLLLGFFVTYYDEVRVYAEFVPLVTTLFLIYLSTFEKFNLRQAEK